MNGPDTLLELEDVSVSITSHGRSIDILQNISFALNRGETIGVVGESGSGKSMMARAIIGLLPKGGELSSGTISFRPDADGHELDLSKMPAKPMRTLRGARIGMVFQEPMASLSPVHTIGAQISTTIRQHQKLSSAAARALAEETLRRVGMADPGGIYDEYPHRISGGMRQRAMIAMAICCEPELLICDEPTTALDVTTEAQIVALLDSLQSEFRIGMVFISHNVALIGEVADRTLIMYLGQLMETGPTAEVFEQACHPYTRGLLGALPGLAKPGAKLVTLRGTAEPPSQRPKGCPYQSRCPDKIGLVCETTSPEDHALSATHISRCHKHVR